MRSGKTQQQKLEELKQRLFAKAVPVQRVLSTPDGQVLLNALREEFGGSLLGETEQETAFKVGAFEVVRYLDMLAKYGERAG